MFKVPADEGNLPEALFREDAELKWKLRKEDGRVHVAEVVRGIDGGFVLAKLLGSDDLDAGEADQEEGAGPEVGDGVLLPTGSIPQSAHERDAAEANGGQANEGNE